MKTRISFLAVCFHSEHCFVQHPLLKVEDEDYQLWNQLKKFCRDNGISAYMNHFVIEGINADTNTPIYLGYNYGKVTLGLEMGSLNDSKKFNINNPLFGITL